MARNTDPGRHVYSLGQLYHFKTAFLYTINSTNLTTTKLAITHSAHALQGIVFTQHLENI